VRRGGEGIARQEFVVTTDDQLHLDGEVPPDPGPDGPPPPARSAARSVGINALSNWGGMAVDLACKLFLLSYLFRQLGREEYGIVQLAMSVAQMAAFLQFGLGGSVLRLASEALAARDWSRLSDLLSCVRTILLGLAAVAWGAAVVVSLFFLDALKVPPESQSAAATLIQLTGFYAACHMASTWALGTLRAAERYYLANLITVGENVLQATIIVALFAAGWGRLETVGVAYAAGGLGMLIASTRMVRRLFPELRLRLFRITRDALREVIEFGFLVAVVTTARTVQNQVGVPIISATLGPAAVPLLAIPRQIGGQFMRVIAGLTQPLRPVATRFAVLGQRDRMARMYTATLRFTGVITVGMLVVLLVYGKPILRVLTDRAMAEESYAVLVVYLALAGVNLLGFPAVSIIMGAGSIRGLTLFQTVTLGVSIVLAIAIAVWTDWGIVGLVAGLNGPSVFYTLGYLSWRVRKETGVRVAVTLLGCVLPPILGAAPAVGAGLAMRHAWPVEGWVSLIAQMMACAAVYAAVAWLLVLKSEERQMLWRLVGRRAR